MCILTSDFPSNNGRISSNDTFKTRNHSDCTVIDEDEECGSCFRDKIQVQSVSFKNLQQHATEVDSSTEDNAAVSEKMDAAAVKVQKAYKSYGTRRNIADRATVIQEQWEKALDFAVLRRCSISFFESSKSETPRSWWARAKTRAAKVGKGLSKNEKAQTLALRHWLEAIDPQHRYGHNLHLYYDVWFHSESSDPFFYWLDIGDGKEINLERCPRTQLQRQCIKYLGPKEREAHEVIVEGGKLVYKLTGEPVTTLGSTKWIFVLSASKELYVGQKQKGSFQHSSFLAGGAAIAAGRLVAHNGILEAIWPYSGHYCPKEEHFMEFMGFLREQHVDLTNVKKCATDDDIPPPRAVNNELNLD